MPVTLRAAVVPAFAAVPRLVHGFEQRSGTGGPESREESRARVTAVLAPSGRLHLMKQVHGVVVRDAPWTGMPEGDAAAAFRERDLLGIETADCLPVLLVAPDSGSVAAAHAGWRGTAAGVAAAAVARLVAAGARPADILAALGPGIGPCCYEVGDELRAQFPGGDAFFVPGPRGKPHLDVRGLNRAQLLAAGLLPEHIHSIDDCTRCRADLYPSYRRDGAGTGRMVSWVGFAE